MWAPIICLEWLSGPARKTYTSDCWPFSGLFQSAPNRPAAPGKGGWEERPTPPRGDAQKVGNPPTEPTDDYRQGDQRGPGLDGPADYGGRGPRFDGPADYEKSHHPQTIAVVVSGIVTNVDSRNMSSTDGHSRNISKFGHEEMLHVTCHVDTVRGETHRHVFTTPVSSTPDGTQCTENVIPVTTKVTTILTTEVPLNQTIPVTKPVTERPVKEQSTCTCNARLIYSITVSAVVGVENIALLLAFIYIMIKLRSCSRSGDPPPPAVASVSRWMLGGAGGRVVSDTAPGAATQTAAGDEPQYSEIPDAYYTQHYNTRPWVEHPYWEIPDEYYNNENRRRLSYPLTLRVPGQGDGDDAVPFYAAVAEVALPPSTRLGGKHPSYSTVPRTRSVPQIHAQQRKARIRSYGAPVASRYRVRDMAAIGRYGRTRGPLMSRAGLYNNPSANRTIH
uniref:Uncharacterized protein n=1 Tax=Branchiostoma floridae TaxID=7739 RepID=C3Z302_BRAFL|eukprot:XP_002597029.1 hypothetical protein BRAFLDRAFT_96179 [Branchiostoma floridae]